MSLATQTDETAIQDLIEGIRDMVPVAGGECGVCVNVFACVCVCVCVKDDRKKENPRVETERECSRAIVGIRAKSMRVEGERYGNHSMLHHRSDSALTTTHHCLRRRVVAAAQ